MNIFFISIKNGMDNMFNILNFIVNLKNDLFKNILKKVIIINNNKEKYIGFCFFVFIYFVIYFYYIN